MADEARAAAPAEEPVELWDDDELRAAVAAYGAMFQQQRAGKHVVKSDVIRDLGSGPLARRSSSSISRRMNNISAVLDEGGMEWMRGYTPLRHVGVNVRARLRRIIEQGWGEGASGVTLPEPAVRVVPVGGIGRESYDVPGVLPGVARHVEQAMLLRYVATVRAKGRTIVGHAYAGGLRCDAFDESINVLIEAKADAGRESARMALGQLLDYRRLERGDPLLAVLLPRRPASPIFDFLVENRVEIIWEQPAGSFCDTRGGALS